jgi:hypothetical protein
VAASRRSSAGPEELGKLRGPKGKAGPVDGRLLPLYRQKSEGRQSGFGDDTMSFKERKKE